MGIDIYLLYYGIPHSKISRGEPPNSGADKIINYLVNQYCGGHPSRNRDGMVVI